MNRDKSRSIKLKHTFCRGGVLVVLVTVLILFVLSAVLMYAITGGNTAYAASGSDAPIAYYDFAGGNLADAVEPSQSTLTQVRSANDEFSYGTGDNGEPYYQWAKASGNGSGLQMDLTLDDPKTYSVGLRFSFGIENLAAKQYLKIVDFNARKNDNGVYMSYGKVMFYLAGAKPSQGAVIKKDEVVDILMTRNGKTNEFIVYSVATVDEKTVLTKIFSIIDTSSNTIPPLVGGKYRLGFGYDDKNGEFVATGRIYAIKAWDKALSPDEIVASMKQPGFNFDGNGADGGSTTNVVAKFNKAIVLTTCGFTRTDCSFISWNTKPDGTGTTYADGETVPNVQKNSTLYAQWQANELGALFVDSVGNDTSGTGTIGSPYATIAKAYTEAASAGSTIYLLGDIEQSENITFGQNKTVAIKSWDSAQYTIKRTIVAGTDQPAFLQTTLLEISAGAVSINNIIIDNGAVWGEGGANGGLQVTKQVIDIKNSAELILGSGTVVQNSAGGAISASGTAKVLIEGATVQDCTSRIGAGIAMSGESVLTMNSGAIRGCRASSGGGAIALYGASGTTATANLNGGVIENNSAGSNFGNAILVYNEGSLNLNPNGMTITGDIGLRDASKPIRVTQVPTGSKTFTINNGKELPTDGTNLKIVDGAEDSDIAGSYGGNILKPYFKVANVGLTLGYQQQPEYSGLSDASALYLVQVTAPAAVIFDGSVATPYHSIQAAIEEVSVGGTETIYVLSVAPAETTYTIYATLAISGGRRITFNSATVTLDTNDSDGIEHTYAKNADGVQTIVLRGGSLSREMVRVEAGSFCTANNIIFDGGALWDNDKIVIEGVDNIYHVNTNNMGVKANAPVFSVAGNFVLDNNAIIQNNENKFNLFGSEQYGGAVRVSGSGAIFTMNTGSAISLCYSREGGAIMNVTKFVNAGKDTVGSTVVVNGGTISGCVSQTKGSAIQTIYGNSVTTINGGTISGAKPHEDNFGVLTVEEGGKLVIAGGTISNTVVTDFAVYVYNRYCDNYSGYLEGNNAAKLELGNATIGKVCMDASGTAKTSGTHPDQLPDLKKEYEIFIVNSASATNAVTYDVTLAGNWKLGNTIIQNKISNYTISGLQDNYYEYFINPDIVVGGMAITQTAADSDGIVTVDGLFIGDPEKFTVTVGGVATNVTISAGSFTAVTVSKVPVGKNEVVLSYSIDSRTLISKMLITVPEVNSEGELTGGVDYGTLENGEKLQYLGIDGAYHEYNGKQLPNDIAIDAKGYADFKLVDSAGDEYPYRAYVGRRVSETEPPENIFGKEKISNTDTTISIETKDGYEYQLVDGNGNIVNLNGNEWNTGTNGELIFKDLDPGKKYTVIAREKGTTTKQPGVSKAVEVQTKTALEQKIDYSKAELDAAAKIAKEEIDSLKNLTAEEKSAAKAAIDEANTAAKTAIDGKTTIEEVTAAADNGKAAITDALNDAKNLSRQNLADAKTEAEKRLDAFIAASCPEGNYSEADYLGLKAKIAQAKAELSAITDISELDQWLSTAISDVKSVPIKAPEYILDKDNDCLAGLSTGVYEVTIDGTVYKFNVGADGKLPLQGKDANGNSYDFADKEISLIKKGADGFADSRNATENIPKRVAKPENVPSGSVVAGKTEITVKGDAVISGNKYAVVDEDGNIVAEGWVEGENGSDIVFTGLKSGKSYKVVTIGKNTNEPDKLPSNPTDGTSVTTQSDKIQKNYIWVILSSVFGALLIAEVIFIIFKRKKKNDGDNGGNSDVKLNSSVLPVLGMIAAQIVAPTAGPIIFGIIAAAIIAVPVTLHLIDKKKTTAPQVSEGTAPVETASEVEKFQVKATEPDAVAKMETVILVPTNNHPVLADIVETERLNAESTATENEESVIAVLEREKAGEQKSKTPDELRLQALDMLLAEYREKEASEERRQVLLVELKKQAEVSALSSGKSVKDTLIESKSAELDAERIAILTLLIAEAEQEEYDIAAAVNVHEVEVDAATAESLKVEQKKAEEARIAFVQAKKSGVVAIPVFSFKISREDVLDYVALCAENTEKFSETIGVKTRKKPVLPDSFTCGAWCYGLLYEKREVIKLVLRFSKKDAEKIAAEHTGIAVAKFPGGEDWFNCVIDSSYATKKEVYEIIDLSYAYVLNKYFKLENGKYATDLEAAKKDSDKTAKDITKNEKTDDPVFDSAIAEFTLSKQAYDASHKLSFEISRRRIVNYVKRTQHEKCEVVEREKWYLPASLKIAGKTYAMVYEKNNLVSLTVRLSEGEAEILSELHPKICRARFPRGNNWYVLPIDGSFYSVQSVYAVLADACKFVEETEKTKKVKPKK